MLCRRQEDRNLTKGMTSPWHRGFGGGRLKKDGDVGISDSIAWFRWT